MIKIKKNSFTIEIKKFLTAIFILIFFPTLLYVGYEFFIAPQRALKKAEKLVKEGYLGLSLEAIDPYRDALVNSEPGCKILLGLYAENKRIDRLQICVEKCHQNKIDIPEVYLAYALVQEAFHSPQEVIKVLQEGLKKFSTNKAMLVKLATTYLKIKQNNEAATLMLTASNLDTQDAALMFETAQLLNSVNRIKEAKPLAEKLLKMNLPMAPDAKALMEKLAKS